MQPDQDHSIPLVRAFDRLHAALTPYVEDAMHTAFGDEWRAQAEAGLRDPYLPQKTWDTHALLLIMGNNWNAAFHTQLGDTGRNLVNELRTASSRDSSTAANPADTYRVLDTAARLLHTVGDAAGAQAVMQEALAVMQRQFQSPPAPPLDDTVPQDDTIELPLPQEEGPEPPGEAAQEKEPAPSEETPEEPDDDEAEAEDDVLEPDRPETDEAEQPVPQEADAPEEALEEPAGAGLRGWFGRLFHKADEHTLEPLELRTRVLDKVEHALKRFRSARPLPFNRITVHILAPTSSDQLTYETALDHHEVSFDQAARHRLYDSGFDLPDNLNFKTEIHAKAPKRLKAAFEEAGAIYVELKQYEARLSATLTVVKGKAGKKSYRVRSTERFNIGRLREVVDDNYGHLVRRNDIAFLDHKGSKIKEEDAAINETVSRRHGRIEFDARAGSFVLVNEQGTTSVSRKGFPRPVSVGHQAVTLQDGDLIYLGRACLRFETKKR